MMTLMHEKEGEYGPNDFSSLWATRVLKRTQLHTKQDLAPSRQHIAEGLAKVYKTISSESAPVFLQSDAVFAFFAKCIDAEARKGSLSFALWALRPLVAEELLDAYNIFLRKENEKRVGFLAETHDGTFELVQIYHEPLLSQVAEDQKNCITDPKYKWVEKTRAQESGARAHVELFVLRAKKPMVVNIPGRPRETSIRPGHTLATLSYYPKQGYFGQIEGAKPKGKINVIVFLTSIHPAFKPLCEIFGKILHGEVPGILLKKRLVPLDPSLNDLSHLFQNLALLSTGERVPFEKAPPEKIILANYAAITPRTPPALLEVASKTARTLDMTRATDAQRALITEVRGSLIDGANGDIVYANLTRVAEGLSMIHAQRVSLPEVAEVFAPRASFLRLETLTAPRWIFYKGVITVPRGALLEAPFAKNEEGPTYEYAN